MKFVPEGYESADNIWWKEALKFKWIKKHDEQHTAHLKQKNDLVNNDKVGSNKKKK